MSIFFFFNDTATTEIYTLSLHDALPIYPGRPVARGRPRDRRLKDGLVVHSSEDPPGLHSSRTWRSEEHTSELQSRQYLVCRLLLEKKKNISHLPSNVTTATLVSYSHRR